MGTKRKALGRRPGPARKRRVIRRKAAVPRQMRVANMAYKRKFFLENWQPAISGSTNGFWRTYNQAFSNLPNNAEIATLFDQYKINAIKFTFVPRFDSFAGNDTTDTTLPGVTNLNGSQLHVCYDNRTTVAPSGTYNFTNFNSFLEQGRVKMFYGNRVFSVYTRPTVTDTIQGVSLNMFQKATWLPTSNTGVTHYCFNAFASDSNFTGNFGNSWDIYVTMYMMLRNMK